MCFLNIFNIAIDMNMDFFSEPQILSRNWRNAKSVFQSDISSSNMGKLTWKSQICAHMFYMIDKVQRLLDMSGSQWSWN